MEDVILLDKIKFEELSKKVKNAKRNQTNNMNDEKEMLVKTELNDNNENYNCKFLDSMINEPEQCRSVQAESKDGKIDCSYGKNPYPGLMEDNSFNNSSVKNDYSIVDEFFCYN